jgi:hypothetical protein
MDIHRYNSATGGYSTCLSTLKLFTIFNILAAYRRKVNQNYKEVSMVLVYVFASWMCIHIL